MIKINQESTTEGYMSRNGVTKNPKDVQSLLVKNKDKKGLVFTPKGIIFHDKLYAMTKNDMDWIKKENTKNPDKVPNRDLRSKSSIVYALDTGKKVVSPLG